MALEEELGAPKGKGRAMGLELCVDAAPLTRVAEGDDTYAAAREVAENACALDLRREHEERIHLLADERAQSDLPSRAGACHDGQLLGL